MLKQFNPRHSIRMLLLLHQEESRGPLLSKPWSNDDGNNDDNKDTVIASASKNHDYHNVVFFVPGLLLWQRTMVELAYAGFY
jgi:hypothetical protein